MQYLESVYHILLFIKIKVYRNHTSALYMEKCGIYLFNMLMAKAIPSVGAKNVQVSVCERGSNQY